MERITGRATSEATAGYVERMLGEAGVAPESYRHVDGLSVSTIGLGTYLGEPDDETDILYTESVLEAIQIGCNVVDTAVNYRYQRSERAVGEALARLAKAGKLDRSEIVLATKGGYVPFEGAPPAGAEGAREYVMKTFVEPGVCREEDFAVRMQHCMAPGYLEHQLEQSLENLGVEAVDIYYIHNPEGQIPDVGRTEFEKRIRAAFELLESKVEAGVIGRYGTATWNGFRRDWSAADHLSLERLVEIAKEVAGDDHHFRVVQLPYNLVMTEAYGHSTQELGEEELPLLDAAERLNVAVFASASLLQARLSENLPDELYQVLPGGTDAQRAIQFARSTPGVASALVGMARTAHVRENLDLLRIAPAPADSINGFFEEAE